MRNIILIGMPGCGKSTVGVLLAKALGFSFLDTDLVIQRREGGLLQEILERQGMEPFLDAEAEAICSVECDRTVIAPGGSAVYRAASMEHLKALGTVVYLRLPLAAVVGRLKNLATRGVAMAPNQTLADLYTIRTPLYEQYADLVLDTAGQTLEETVDAVLCALSKT